MKAISKFCMGLALCLVATTALASPPAAICLNMPLTITPLFDGGGPVKKKVLPFCFETKDFVLNRKGDYVPSKPFIRAYGSGGFSANVALEEPTYNYTFVSKDGHTFGFPNVCAVWDSIFAAFYARSLQSDGFVSLVLGTVPSNCMTIRSSEVYAPEDADKANVLFMLDTMEHGEKLFARFVARAFDAAGHPFHLVSRTATGDVSVSIVEQ
jgi:hypothetical protein